MANRLAGETSPYLVQHSENPVEWYPWGGEALERARALDRPILLSIGYSACHWCHVMAHESFEDPATAALMNEHFVCIKVDREERPDLDAIYMQAVQAMSGHGGWPMTMFLTPDGEPFYGGTYFPPVDRHGMPAFSRILAAVADSYANRRESIASSAASMRAIYEAAASRDASTATVDEAFLEKCARAIESGYDRVHGGFGSAPKFPPTMVLDFLLRHWARTGHAAALEIAKTTFLKMARGGIHDQVGGGFARYSVDDAWLIPHFEKMLYDNALLIRFGAHLYEATHDHEVRRVTQRIVEWLAREMTSPEGGFHSSLDADSEGVEGKFYLWTPHEIDAVLDDDAELVKSFYGVSDSGNFEGQNILHADVGPDEFAAIAGLGADTFFELLDRSNAALYRRRAQRVRPGLDDKILASWNGLALRGIAEAARAFDRDDFRQLAARNGEFLAKRVVVHGRAWRTWKNGELRIPGFLEDQAGVALGLLALFEQTLDVRWMALVRTMANVMLDMFHDDVANVFHDTARDAEQLVTRPRDPTDNAMPSGTSLAVDLLLRLSTYDDNERFRAIALGVIASVGETISRYPSAFGHMLGDAEYAVTFACHGEYCDMPSPRALERARATAPLAS